MKKALVIGGSNGIGLAIAIKLIDKGFFVNIMDRQSPDAGVLPEKHFKYYCFDMMDIDEDLLSLQVRDPEISVLMITAGIGRVASFEFCQSSEIKKTMTVNATSTIQVVRCFYDRIKADKLFYCGIMGSISGFISSPLMSIYAASKAAVCRFIESVNIELENAGTRNRILNISPASFKGSRFYGGQNQIDLLEIFASEIVNNLFDHKTLFIPQYKELLKNVIESYHNNPHEFGLNSYQYKIKSGRLDNNRHEIIGYLSGTFDLFHVGHLNLIRRAKQQCDYLIVGVHNSGAWKGKDTFIPLDERKQIVGACKYVDKVVDSCTEDSDAWNLWHFDRLFVGSDYKGTERFIKYEDFFKDKGVEIVYFPYTQSTSSTQIRKTIMLNTGNQ